jgi:predicted permease
MFEACWHDVRYGTRLLLRSPVFTAVAAASLAIGIGANTTIFSVVNALLLRPRPGLVEAGLVDVGRTQEGSGFDNMSYPNYVDYREASRDVLVDLAAFRLEPEPVSLTRDGEALRIYGTMVSGNYFEVLGVRPAAGRFFRPDEDVVAGERLVAVASYRFWRDQLGGDPGAVGGSITLNGVVFTVVGVAPPGFTGTSVLSADVWVPLHALMRAGMFTERRAVWLVGVGRLKPGTSVRQAQAALGTVATRLEHDYPVENRGKGVTVVRSSAFPGQAGFFVTMFMTLLMALVSLILLIASVNVAGMLLARATARRREIAVRLAIGAGRGRLIRQLLTESLLLFVMGCGLGVALAFVMRAALLRLLPHLPVPVAFDLALDARVLAFAVAVSLGAGVLTGLVPALQTARTSVVAGLKDDARASGPATLRLRNMLVASQIALALLLVVAAGLMLRALQHAGHIDPGFDPTNVEVASIDLRLAGLDDARGPEFWSQLLERVRALPGIEHASLAVDLPLDGGGYGFGGVEPIGRPSPTPDGRPVTLDWNIVTPGFFETMRIRLVEGRGFTDDDRQGAPAVAVVNETLANRLWPGQSAIGRRLLNRQQPFAPDIRLEVVGVEKDLKYRSLGEGPRNFIYVPLAQRFNSRLNLVVRRTEGPSVLPAVRRLTRELNPNLPIIDAQSLSSYISLGLMPQRIALSVAGTLGIVGLLLAAIGIYGVTAYSVSRRTREIGIRMALGASRERVVGQVVTSSLRLAAVGIVVGLAFGLGASRALASLLYGIGTSDPVTYVSAALAFAAVTLVATYLPARRAATIDPLAALRQE